MLAEIAICRITRKRISNLSVSGSNPLGRTTSKPFWSVKCSPRSAQGRYRSACFGSGRFSAPEIAVDDIPIDIEGDFQFPQIVKDPAVAWHQCQTRLVLCHDEKVEYHFMTVLGHAVLCDGIKTAKTLRLRGVLVPARRGLRCSGTQMSPFTP